MSSVPPVKISDSDKTTEFAQAVEHLNRVVSLIDLRIPPLLTSTADAASFLLWAHRQRGTQIRQSVYDFAVALDNQP